MVQLIDKDAVMAEIKDPVHLNDIEDAYHAGAEDILNKLASRIESAEIVNVRQVLEWIEEQTKE